MNNEKNIEKALKDNGFLVCPVVGDSMLPMLNQTRDLVKLVPVNGILKKYDLPLYRRPDGTLVLHRIIEVRKNYYIICGDNRKNPEKVPHGWVIAVTEGYYKDGTYIPCTDPGYIEYVEKQCANIAKRDIIRPYATAKKNPFKKFFLPYGVMADIYPSLSKHPALLPFYWIHRAGKGIIRRTGPGE